MNCPNCGAKGLVIDTVNDQDANEIYRQRKCQSCGNKFYTLEFEIVYDERMRDIWDKWRRHNVKEKKDD